MVETTVTEALARRERKRNRTRFLVQTEALRLFAEKGYESTTVEEIAAAADVSARTFFRYFATKEDVVLWDEYDEVAPELFESRPPDEPPAESVRAIVHEILGGLVDRDRDRLLARVQLMATVPELRARHLDHQQRGLDQLAAALAGRRRGRPVDELELRVVVAALAAAIGVAVDLWQKENGKLDLVELFDRTLRTLAESIGAVRDRG